MTLATPTIADFAYGPRLYHRCDVYQNLTRLSVDTEHPQGQNPVLFWRHGGGGRGDYQDARDSTITAFWHFWRWLLGEHPSVEPGRHWDVIVFTSAQQNWVPFASFSAQRIERSESTFFPKVIEDCQYALAQLTHYCRQLGFDPTKRAGGGDSYGAWMMALAQLRHALLGSGGKRTWLEGNRDAWTHDSKLKALIYHLGQIDWRRPGGVQTFTTPGYAGYIGSETGSQASLDAVPEELLEAMSLLQYLERAVQDPNEVVGLPGIATVWENNIGNHVKPYADLHDSAQQGALDSALAAINHPRISLPLSGTGLGNPNYPGAPTGSVLARYVALEGFLAQRLVA